MTKARARPTSRRIRRAAQKLPKQREQKHAPQPTLMARERILHQLEDAIAACDELFAEHGEGCQCEACCIVSNMVGSMRVFHMVLAIT